MTEQNTYNNYQSESRVSRLYYFREAARAYLEEINTPTHIKDDKAENTPLSRMFNRFGYVAEDIAPDKAQQILSDIAAPVTEFLCENSDRSFAAEPWFMQNVSDAARQEMADVLSAGKKLSLAKEKAEQKLTTVFKDKPQTEENISESEETQVFRAEISAIIQKSRKYTDEQKGELLNALAEAPEIAYVRKKTQITYQFGGFEVIGQVSDGSSSWINKNGVKVYSSGEQMDLAFAKTLKSRGKIKTALGAKKVAAVLQEKKNDKKSADIKKRCAELERKIAQNSEEQQRAFHKMIKSLSPKFLIADMADPEGFLATVAKESHKSEEWQMLQQRLVAAVFSNKPVWSAYMPQKDNACHNQKTRFDDEVEKVLNRHNERENLVNAGRVFYREFEKMATDDKKQFDATKLDDEMLKKLFHKSVMMIKADLPLNVKKEVMRQEIFRQALTRDGNIGFNEQRFQMMNRVLALEGIKIELKEVPIKQKLNTSSARSFSSAILENMKEGYNLQQKHKTEALLYYLGKFRAQHRDKNLKDAEKNPVLKALFCEFSEVFYGKTTSNLMMKPLWDKFVTDLHNLRQADQVYQMFNKMRVPGVNVEKLIQKLASGMGVNEKNSLVQQSKHHQLYRRFAGFFGNDINELNKMFNAPERIIDTIAIHPALKDVHRDVEHRFDMGEEYLYQKADGRVIFGAYSAGEVGDTLLMPVICVKNKEGKFEPLMKEGTLLMTSTGAVKMPHFEGEGQGLRKLYHSTGARISPQN